MAAPLRHVYATETIGDPRLILVNGTRGPMVIVRKLVCHGEP
jgi:hypothetical protein